MDWIVDTGMGNSSVFSAVIENGEIIIIVSESHKDSSIIYTLSSFNTIRFQQFNPRVMSLIGQKITRTFKFRSEDAILNIWDFFNRFANIKPVFGERKVFTISRELFQCSASNMLKKSFSLPNITINADEMPKIHFKEHMYKKLNNVKEILEFFSTPVRTLFIVDNKILLEAWIKLMNVNLGEEMKQDFGFLLQQVSSISSEAWESNHLLRKSVQEAEKKIDDSQLTTTAMKRSAMIIIMTVIFQESNGYINYHELIDLVIFLVRKTCVSEDEKGNIILYSHEIMKITDYCFILFSLVSEIYNSEFWNPPQTLSSSILKSIDSLSPNVGKEIRNIEIRDISFMLAAIRSFFMNGKGLDEQTLLFTYFLGTKCNIQAAARYIASVLSFMENTLRSIPSECPCAFEPLLIKCIRSTPAEEVLLNMFINEKEET